MKLFLAFVLVFSIGLVTATPFGYDFLEHPVQSIINGSNYSINVNNSNFLEGHPASYFYPNSNPFGFINSTNSTQFDNNAPIHIKESWLTSFINLVVDLSNYWTKTENINITGYNLTANKLDMGLNNSYGVISNGTDFIMGYINGL